ncbi:hypothetical protein ATDW_06090 [Asticcacaulis sp. DW145]|uniref:Uncharacterized protein n=1 Tax=Asticcacaulis currens TaxID=2984210 RepID=A0ABT5IEP4_9CAUL|nr:hypothetical protein [Asticcacaulis currens]MDC7693941.1 hypothetical protein [Asticcacaulis currens]BEV10113.1 hypothetical protein ATDW_06090 [Asticcacaulis sp. DW145]
MSALFDIIIGFITALVSAAFLHFGAGAAPEQPKPGPVSQPQAAPTSNPSPSPTTQAAPMTQPVADAASTDEKVSSAKAAPAVVAVKATPKTGEPAVTAQVVQVRATHSEPQVALSPVAPVAPAAPPSLALPPLPLVPAIRLHIAQMSAEDQARIASEVESGLRAAEHAGAFEVAVRADDVSVVIDTAKAVKAVKAARKASEAKLSGPCPDSHGVPSPTRLRTIVAQ